MYTQNYYKKTFTFFIKKKLQLYKKISTPQNYKKISFSAIYNNGKPRAKFVIK